LHCVAAKQFLILPASLVEVCRCVCVWCVCGVSVCGVCVCVCGVSVCGVCVCGVSVCGVCGMCMYVV
jgi:hypothetical protein